MALFLTAAVFIAGCAADDQRNRQSTPAAKKPASPQPDAHTIVRDFGSMKYLVLMAPPKLSPIVVNCDSSTYSLRPAAAASAVRVFMNELASAAYDMGKPAYPVGSVIVKEKLATDGPGNLPGDPNWKHAGLGGMIKRAPGYDPGNGDWEYFFARDRLANVETGRIATCVQCHAGGATRDHVFGAFGISDIGRR